MGVDIMFKMRHNLDVSSVSALSSELQRKLGCIVRGFVNPVEVEYLELLELPIPEYDTNGIKVNIYVEDDYSVARALIAAYGDAAQKRIEKYPNLQHIISQLDAVRRGMFSYTINDDTLMDFGIPCIWGITNDTISGTPGFGNDRWYQFTYALDQNARLNNKYRTRLIESRKQLFEFLKPLLVDEYLYYYADQGLVSELSWVCYFDDIPDFLAKLNYEIFDLSEYILNADSKQIYNSQEIDYVIRDDFKGIS